jgi:CRP-like cAMP-binding protein
MTEQLLDQIQAMGRYRRLSPSGQEQLAHIVGKLRHVGLFESLSLEELAYIAERARLVRYQAGDLFIRKGDADKTLYVIIDGQVRVWDRNEEGRGRLLNYHSPGDFVGELAFLEDKPRSANVDVITDAELVAFDREGFERILAHPQISDYMRSWGQERIRKSNQSFEGKQWDEITIVMAHKSWFGLARAILAPSLILLVVAVLLGGLILLSAIADQILISVLLAVVVGIGLWIFWMYQDWENDDLIVTSKRVIQIERVLVPPFPIERHEVSLSQVQDMTTRNHGLWTSLFGIETLVIRTSGAGLIEFPYLEDAEWIRDEIFRARELARMRRIGEERSQIRSRLMDELDRPSTRTYEPLQAEEGQPITPEPEGLLKVVDYFVPRTRIVKPDRIIWRKHWWILVRKVTPPALFSLFSASVLALTALRPGFLGQVPLRLVVPIPAGVTAFSLLWWLWRYDGWRNDIYIVTDQRIIDVEGSPFHIKGESRIEGTFDVIQSTDYSSPNWLYRILRIGDVTIDTASKQAAFTFDEVARPDEVQQEIFRRLTAYREERAREETERQYAEFSRWFGTYHRSVMEQKEY